MWEKSGELEDMLENLKSEAREILPTAHQQTALSNNKTVLAKEMETQYGDESQPVSSQSLELQSLLGK